MVLRDAVPDPEREGAWLRRRAALGTDPAARVDVWPMDQESWDTGWRLHGHPVRFAEQEGMVLHESG